jgi:hypothetical protein
MQENASVFLCLFLLLFKEGRFYKNNKSASNQFDGNVCAVIFFINSAYTAK